MNILCPLSPAADSHLDKLAAAGAGEFFMGYASSFACSSIVLSRRPWSKCNYSGLAEVAEITQRIHALGLTSHLAVNNTFYPGQFVPRIHDDLDAAVEMGIDGFIMADFNLFLEFRKRHPRAYVTASTCLHAMNSSAVGFLEQLGFSRVVLPRHLTVAEMRTMIAKHAGLDFEVFVKNDECPNVDGLCSYFHGVIEGEALNPDAETTDTACAFITTANGAGNEILKMDYCACGVCDLFALQGLPNVSLKISGRNLLSEQLLRDVEFVAGAMKRLAHASSERQYRNDCASSHEAVYGRACGHRCYREVI